MVVFSRNPVFSVLYLVITLFSIAGHYVLMDAQFLAAVHVIVYAGAIMVLFLYVIMLLNLNKETEPQKGIFLKVAATASTGLLMVVLIGSLKGADQIVAANQPVEGLGYVKHLGQILFKDFLLPFEISSLLLLAAMVGAVMLGRKEK